MAYCDPLEEFREIVDKVPPELLKVFRIAQLTIRYLLQSQDMLTEAIQKLKNNNELTHQVKFLHEQNWNTISKIEHKVERRSKFNLWALSASAVNITESSGSAL